MKEIPAWIRSDSSFESLSSFRSISARRARRSQTSSEAEAALRWTLSQRMKDGFGLVVAIA